jgi:hypothetical protein
VVSRSRVEGRGSKEKKNSAARVALSLCLLLAAKGRWKRKRLFISPHLACQKNNLERRGNIGKKSQNTFQGKNKNKN